MMTKILITGSSGFLGSRLAYYYRDRFELLLPSHAELNVSREEAVRAYMEENRPDIVVHCAALSNTWYCEQHPEESHRVNVQGTVRIAKACKLTGAKLIFMSSDQVYNGTPLLGALKEEDVLQPVNIYGQHKLECEQRAQWNPFPRQHRRNRKCHKIAISHRIKIVPNSQEPGTFYICMAVTDCPLSRCRCQHDTRGWWSDQAA